MLKLKNITKDYKAGDSLVHALKGINITFNEKGIVGILGPSGCGKSTLLNIIGGLDQYTTGDLLINGRSTKTYEDRDWDTYRNHSIGFIFQQYNLIPHLTLVENVELALTIAGLTTKDKRRMSEEALEKVGLKGIENKYPNQLSGGQQQRVAIARALVNNPDIILADEPTGALDTETSIQVMEILKAVGKEKLIIMVTHNPELAYEYSDRIIKMKDGLVLDDSKPLEIEDEKPQQDDKKRPSMKFWTAVKLSFKNLVSKKGRTLTTGFAGSIGIIGIALILAFSTGTTNFMNSLLDEAVNTTPIKVASLSLSADAMSSMTSSSGKGPLFPNSENGITPYEPEGSMFDVNHITDDYVKYVDKLVDTNGDLNYASAIQKEMGTPMHLFKSNDSGVSMIDTSLMVYTEELPVTRYEENTPSLIEAHYENLAEGINGSHMPTKKNELALVVDNHSSISTKVLDALNINYRDSNGEVLSELPYDQIIGKEYKLLLNDAYYKETLGRFTPNSDVEEIKNYVNGEDIEGKTITLEITAVIRQKKSQVPSMILLPGLGYTPSLTNFILQSNEKSEVVLAQKASPDINVLTGIPFNGEDALKNIQFENALKKIGGIAVPKTIYIYAKDQGSKDKITEYLNAWNDMEEHSSHQMTYFDSLEITSNMLNNMMNIITIVLACFSGISLIVSSVMIGIITYVSVIERTKEIGVLRALGASKRNIRQVFNAEAVIIGFLAGALGVGITYILQLGINGLFSLTLNIGGICNLTPLSALGLVAVSTLLTAIAGVIPSNKAAKKDPVECLRSE